MTELSKLKLSATKRETPNANPVELARAKLCERLEEQREIANADIAGEPYTKMSTVYLRDASTGERVPKQKAKSIRRWFWHDVKGVWYLELRYGNKPLAISRGKTTIEVGERSKLVETIEIVMGAVKQGQLDEVLIAARKDRSRAFKK